MYQKSHMKFLASILRWINDVISVDNSLMNVYNIVSLLLGLK